MAHFRVAQRYARSLLAVAEEQKKLKKVLGDMKRIGTLIRSSRELELFFQNPSIGESKKKAVCKDVFEKSVDELTFKFIMLLVQKGRERIILQIIEQFGQMVDEKMGIVRAHIRSAIELDKKQQKKLNKQLEGYTGKTVEATYSLDTALKGGFLARLGDTVFDASIRRQLEILEKKFKSDSSLSN